jgi:hypothetical protein
VNVNHIYIARCVWAACQGHDLSQTDLSQTYEDPARSPSGGRVRPKPRR